MQKFVRTASWVDGFHQTGPKRMLFFCTIAMKAFIMDGFQPFSNTDVSRCVGAYSRERISKFLHRWFLN